MIKKETNMEKRIRKKNFKIAKNRGFIPKEK